MNRLWKKFKLLFNWLRNPQSRNSVPVFNNHLVKLEGHSYLLCRALITDIPELVKLRQQVFPQETAWNRKVFADELKNTQEKLYLLLRFNDQLVAFIGTDFDTKQSDIHITSLAVANNFQHQGLATFLLKVVRKIAQQRNFQTISLEVRLSNKSAQQLYTNFGFVCLGLTKEYYQSNLEDAINMQYMLKKESKINE
ncbi:MAG: ribosomal protein S18-alanine N-acetyltransferase [Liquorilactobacillus ghanensis]|uniref:ribosomal protein S18-alanine N-acetyltransferase n=1 Tax=Liquorilactobacillus ghanensis TaxID=399370 RepID=UPI0039E73AE2